jgi:hypothetical protein
MAEEWSEKSWRTFSPAFFWFSNKKVQFVPFV